MAKGLYIGNTSSIAKKVKSIYMGGGNIAKKIKKMYLGDTSGKAKEGYEGNNLPKEAQTLTRYYNGSGNGTTYISKFTNEDYTTYKAISVPIQTGDANVAIPYDYINKRYILIYSSYIYYLPLNSTTWTTITAPNSSLWLRYGTYINIIDPSNGNIIIGMIQNTSNKNFQNIILDSTFSTATGAVTMSTISTDYPVSVLERIGSYYCCISATSGIGYLYYSSSATGTYTQKQLASRYFGLSVIGGAIAHGNVMRIAMRYINGYYYLLVAQQQSPIMNYYVYRGTTPGNISIYKTYTASWSYTYKINGSNNRFNPCSRIGNKYFFCISTAYSGVNMSDAGIYCIDLDNDGSLYKVSSTIPVMFNSDNKNYTYFYQWDDKKMYIVNGYASIGHTVYYTLNGYDWTSLGKMTLPSNQLYYYDLVKSKES